MSHRALVGFLLGLFALVVVLVFALPLCMTTSCTPAARSEADAVAVELTDMVCSPSDPLDSDPIVEVVCVALEGAEKVAGMLLDGSADVVPMKDIQVKSVTLHVTPAQAARILKRHGKKHREAGAEGGAD